MNIPGLASGNEGSIRNQRRVPGINVDEVPVSGYADNELPSARNRRRSSGEYEPRERLPLSGRKTIDDDAKDFDEGSGIFEGEHPLEGITNYSELPPPEPLSGKSKYV